MADPTLVVRVAANLAEFKANLAEGVDQVETYKSALSRAASAFDGSRIVQQASAAASAIQNAGGVTSLTASEMAKANSLFTDAAAKLDLMGKGGTYAAQQFTALADATKQVQKPTEDLGRSWVERIAEGLLLRDAINELLAKAKELVIGIPEEAHQLQILSLQTQINVEDLQVLSAATRAYGVDGDQLGRALFQLSRRIAGGDQSVATAYHLMGMSLDEVRDKSPMQLFLATERGLGTLQGTIRDTAAADLYGGKLGVSMGAFSTGVDEAMEKARRLNTIASVESVKAASDYAEAIDRATHSVHAWVMEIEGRAAQGFNTLADASTKGASKWDLFNAMVADSAVSWLGWTTSTKHVADLLDKLNQATDKDIVLTKASAKAHAGAVVALDAHAEATRFMTSLELDSAKPLLEWQTAYLQHMKDIGDLNAKNAAGIGVTADQLKRYTAETAASEKATEAAYKQVDEFDKLLEHLDKVTYTMAMEHQKQWTAEQLARLKLTNTAVLAEFDAQTKLNAEWGENAAGAIQLQASALDVLTQKLAALHASKLDGISQEKQEQVLTDEYTKQLYDEAVAQDKVAASIKNIANASSVASDSFSTFVGTLVLGVTDITSVNAALGKFYDTFALFGGVGAFNGKGGQGTPIGNSAGQTYVPGMNMIGHADGIVNNPRGHWAIVGERGPERMYVPQGASILPSGSSVGSTVLNIYVTQPLGTPQAIAAAIDDVLGRRMKQSRQYPAG